MLLAAVLAVVLAAAAPALAHSGHAHNPNKGDTGHIEDFAGLVDIQRVAMRMGCMASWIDESVL